MARLSRAFKKAACSGTAGVLRTTEITKKQISVRSRSLVSNPARLRISSPELRLRPLRQTKPFSATVEGWTISESFNPGQYLREGYEYGSYRVELGRDINTGDDAGNVYIEGCFLAQRLDQVWVYSTGLRLGARGFDLFLSPTEPPPDWTSNGEAVVPEGDWRLLNSRISYLSTYRTTASLPLRASVRALKAFDKSDEVTQQLCSYHFAALTTQETDVHFLLLAQGLEIARALLPGKSAADKEKALPATVRKALAEPLNWLFEMAQQRRETRHAIDKRSIVSLKPSLTHDEELHFVHDANLILQFVASHQLSIPLVLNDDSQTIRPVWSHS